MTSSDNTGLGLFEDAASAAGNFPSALRGYDRAAVDDYIRTLEANTVEVRQRASELERETDQLRRQLEESRHNNEVDYTNLGGRASEILRLAEEQARDVMERATADAERLREEARREADSTRDRATREGDELKNGGLAEIDKVRAKLEADGATHVDRAKAEAEALLAAGRRQAESLRREAEHDAQTVRQQTYLDTEELRRTVEREIADTRQEIAAEREAALSELRRAQEEASGQTTALLAEATRFHEESGARLEADIREATRIREDAIREAEQLKLASITEAEERVDTAKKQAAAISERTQAEFAWRKEQLRRETDLLGQRKQAVLAQLASLTALAQETATSFPEPDDLDAFDAELGDRTVAMPAGLAPALPDGRDKSELDAPAVGETADVAGAEPAEPVSQAATETGGTEAATHDVPARNDVPATEDAPAPGDEAAVESPESDPDATVVISAEEMAAQDDKSS
ncbi:MAG TPA: DivIVA domain-containing protein [Microlunatus sp.]|nr:DivIVA domain-containing protein [Microlunatus sp.]